MGKTVRELRRGMTSEDLSYWLAYDRLDRIPDHYWMIGMMTSAIVNALTGAKTKPDDFIPRPRPVRILSGNAGLAWFQGIAAKQAMRAGQEVKPSP